MSSLCKPRLTSKLGSILPLLLVCWNHRHMPHILGLNFFLKKQKQNPGEKERRLKREAGQMGGPWQSCFTSCPDHSPHGAVSPMLSLLWDTSPQPATSWSLFLPNLQQDQICKGMRRQGSLSKPRVEDPLCHFSQ